MKERIEKLLRGEEENHILPFFWQHGEDEDTLRRYMRVIHEAHCGAVCVESRPHPDFCGEKWWSDLGCILDEAERLGMKVWVLDDSHFPTGYANGALKEAPPSLCRQNIVFHSFVLCGDVDADLRALGAFKAPERIMSEREKKARGEQKQREFDDDEIVCCVARQGERLLDLLPFVQGERLRYSLPDGEWTLYTCVATRNSGYHREYIRMTSPSSCRVLIDAVYEPHYAHFSRYFGNTFVGFFSDEPELGNGLLYAQGNTLGSEQDLPWGEELRTALEKRLGDEWRTLLPLLWVRGEEALTVRVRYIYMDALTRLTSDSFSEQIGDWCRAHGVEYIGHVIEDNGQHCRTGSSLGHYFRGLSGQDMSGIDDIGGQVLPQGEDEPTINNYRKPRNGEFYHYGLASLARSAAAIEPRKRGRAMCEIFGNYGWAEGVRLEKYLVDHFLVRGVSHFVPHAFSPKAFPDPDCPPHFYADGHDAQFRHFGALMQYVNRIATLTEGAKHQVSVAVLYHAEADWTQENAMPFERPLRKLYDAQIDCHVIPSDVFSEREKYRVSLGKYLTVNENSYQTVVIPATDYLTEEAALALAALCEGGCHVVFVDKRPSRAYEGGELPQVLKRAQCVSLSELLSAVEGSIAHPLLSPADDRIRILWLKGETDAFLLVNEGDRHYEGEVILPVGGRCCRYDAWSNRCSAQSHTSDGGRTRIRLCLAPLHSTVIVFGMAGEQTARISRSEELTKWRRSICEGAAYPSFGADKEVTLPDNVAAEYPEFSGYVRYERELVCSDTACAIEIEDAYEGVELFVNGVSAGLQIIPPFRYDIGGLLREGRNTLAIEVATTLERQCYPQLDWLNKLLSPPPSAPTGLYGRVFLMKKEGM